MKTILLIVLGVALGGVAVVLFRGPSTSADQPGAGRTVDRIVGEVRHEARHLGSQIREGIREAREKIDQFGVEGRVYARLHWDKELSGASISADVDNNALTVLRGTVPSEAAKTRAEQIAKDTVGVGNVRNELAVRRAP